MSWTYMLCMDEGFFNIERTSSSFLLTSAMLVLCSLLDVSTSASRSSTRALIVALSIVGLSVLPCVSSACAAGCLLRKLRRARSAGSAPPIWGSASRREARSACASTAQKRGAREGGGRIKPGRGRQAGRWLASRGGPSKRRRDSAARLELWQLA